MKIAKEQDSLCGKEPEQRTCIYNPKTKVLSINSNILNRELLDITNALESIYYELRKIYQKEAISYISNMKDFYLLLDTILHKETFSNPEEAHEIYAKLYSKVKAIYNDVLSNLYINILLLKEAL